MKKHDSGIDRVGFPAELVAERERLGISRNQASRFIGCNDNTYEAWEDGRRNCQDYIAALILERMRSCEPGDFVPDVPFCDTLKETLKSKGLTVLSASEILGCDSARLYKWQQGRQVPPQYVQSLVLDKLNET